MSLGPSLGDGISHLRWYKNYVEKTRMFFCISTRQERSGILDKVTQGISFYHLKAVELMLLIPMMLVDNARLLRRFSGKEDHFTNLLFHDEYFSAENVRIRSSFHVGILHNEQIH